MAAPIWPVLFDEQAWRVDLAAASDEAQRQALAWRQRITALGGIPHEHLQSVEQLDNADPLPGCVKTRIPDPSSNDIRTSPWGAVLRADLDNGKPCLVFAAFGLRHPEATGSHQPSVYARAARRV
jgi:hypothetical protein